MAALGAERIMKQMNGWVVAGICGVVFAGLFVLLGGLAHGYAPRSVACLAVAGLLLGAIAAPEIEPKVFRFPAVWQILFGALAGIAVVSSRQPSTSTVLAGAMIGGVLGFFAPYWIKHIQVP